jgi:DeoR/GlpR family transcriptional regulator of sugar metabolism
MIDDSTSSLQLVPHLHLKAPLTVITNTITIMEQLRGVKGITLLGIGGEYVNWASSFMGGMTTTTIASLRADLLVMSTAAIDDGMTFHQMTGTVDVKRAMFEASAKRILLADHTKFARRALHATLPLAGFDAVIVDAGADPATVAAMRESGVNVIVARRTHGSR